MRTATAIQSLHDHLQDTLTPRRFLHVLGVTHTAVALAMRHGRNSETVALAALLHDVSKPIKPDEIRRQMQAWGTDIEPDDLDHPQIWHGMHAEKCASEWDALKGRGDRSAILEGVKYHSTAEENTSPEAQIVYLADALEPSRDYDGIDELRSKARRSINEGLEGVLNYKREYVLKKDGNISPRAERALAQLKKGEKT